MPSRRLDAKDLLARVKRRAADLQMAVVRLVIRILPASWLAPIADRALRFRLCLHERMRKEAVHRSPRVVDNIVAWNGDVLCRSVLERRVPWVDIPLASSGIPTMLNDTIKRYYTWLARFYAGSGSVVELGCWLGSSTFYIVQGLTQNPAFRGRQLYVCDDFTWRSGWMDDWVERQDITRPKHGESFEKLFANETRVIERYIVRRRGKLCTHQSNEAVPSLTWTDGPIEMLFVDVGRLMKVNEAWWDILAPSFIRGRTLIVMEDWGSHKRIPEEWWENMKIFTDSKADEIELIHEVLGTSIATFLYTRRQ